jgi:hypothetical protein
MAVYRKSPKCPYCGKEIKRIYENQSKTLMLFRKIGYTFIKWDYEGHKCLKTKKMKKTLNFL